MSMNVSIIAEGKSIRHKVGPVRDVMEFDCIQTTTDETEQIVGVACGVSNNTNRSIALYKEWVRRDCDDQVIVKEHIRNLDKFIALCKEKRYIIKVIAS